MSANRKLQGEIQIVLKKVEEGVEIFDEIWGKVYAAEQQTLKEKYESDLKKEIKKLQRLRDQIKTWLSSNEIKDKTQIMEARKTIESKMELFKVCEKDTKTKAYSKEGLAREAKLDPKEALKEEKRGWLNDCLDKLNDLVDSVEAEREKVLGTSKGKSKNKESLERFDNRVQKHKWHMAKLELIIKLLDNDDLDPALVSGIQDSLDYYIESAADDDGALGVEHEFDIYEELELDSHGVSAPTIDLSRPVKEDEDASSGDAADAADSETPVPAGKKATAASGVGVKGKSETGAASAAKATATTTSKASPKIVPAVPLAAATTVKNGTSKGKAGVAVASVSDEADESTAEPVAPLVVPAATPAAGSNMSWAAHAASAVPASSLPPTATAPRSQSVVPVSASPAVAPTPALVPAPSAQQAVKSPTLSSVPSPTLVPAKVTSLSPQTTAAPGIEVPAQTAVPVSSFAQSPASTVAAPPPPPLQQAKVNPELMTIMSQLKQSMTFSPEAMELDKQSSLLQYVPRNVYAHTHPTFPSAPQFTTQSELADLFERLPMDTLFFVFYFQQGTYQQFLAARQLKKHSWRFHKKYMTWFQRHEEPKVATEEYEEGTYVYFDYESGWCQRIKSEFKFEYAYLEDELGGVGDA